MEEEKICRECGLEEMEDGTYAEEKGMCNHCFWLYNGGR